MYIAKDSSWKRLCPSWAWSILEAAWSQRVLAAGLAQLGISFGGCQEDQEVPGRSGCGLPGSCHTGEAAACTGG